MNEKLLTAAAAALAGGLLSWASTSLTLVGRVDAIEKSMQRVEQSQKDLLTVVLQQQKGKP